MAQSVFLDLTDSGQVDNSIIPIADNLYDLGSSSFRWRSAYLGTSLIGTINALGTTSTLGAVFQNTTAAAAGAQQISPGFDLVGQGWKTDATAASQEVRWRQEVLPVQGTSAPTSTWKLKASVNAGAFSEILTASASAVTSTVPIIIPDGTTAAPGLATTTQAGLGFYRSGAGKIGFVSPNYGTTVAALNFSDTGLNLADVYVLGWSGSANATGAPDTALSRGAANRLDLASGDSFRVVLGNVEYANANGQLFSALQQLTELTTIAAAATTDTTIQMPANSVVLGVSVRVTTVIPTAATFTVGDSGSAARFSTAAVSAAANSTDPGTKAGAYYNASALSIRITPNLTPADATGRLRVTIYYYAITPPTS